MMCVDTTLRHGRPSIRKWHRALVTSHVGTLEHVCELNYSSSTNCSRTNIRARPIVRARIFELEHMFERANMRYHECSLPHANARPIASHCCVDTHCVPISCVLCTCIVVMCRLQSIRAVLYTCYYLSLIHISEPTRRTPMSYAVFCLKK